MAAGYHRRFLITPRPGEVTAALEDDYHCMSVTISHDGKSITSAIAVMERAPWTTCPGAPAVLAETFAGVALADAAARGAKAKPSNCTHLHDLALLAAAHAADAAPTRYDIFASDPVDGVRVSELARDGALLLHWEHRDDVLEAPEALRGLHILKLRDWIQSLPEAEREPARLLQWASLVAHGRTVPMELQMDATRMPPNCFTFQPDRAAVARRVGKIIDFSAGGGEPLDHFDGERFAARLVA
jgi:hypothetical protein